MTDKKAQDHHSGTQEISEIVCKWAHDIKVDENN